MGKYFLSIFKGKLLKYFPIGEGETLIGSDPACPVFIDSLAVQSRHASVTIEPDKAILRDLGTPDGTYVNDAHLSGDYTLRDGDVIRVGKHELTYTAETVKATVEEAKVLTETDDAEAETDAVSPQASVAEAAPEPEETAPESFSAEAARPRHAFLQILNGQNLGKTISLNRKLTNLGKPGVQTAVIAHRNDGYFLTHLEGEVPPKVGDTSIGDKAWQLQDGDIIHMGNVRLQFYLH